MEQRTKSRLTLVALFGLFLLPVLAAVVLQSEWVDWDPPAVKQSGTLISPVVPLPASINEQLGAEPGQWSLVQVEGNRCAAECLERHELIVHLQALLSREQDKLNRVVATADPGGLGELPVPPRLVTASATIERLNQLGDNTPGLILVDPLGNAMMRYPADFDPVGLRSDMARLLKKSKFLGEEAE